MQHTFQNQQGRENLVKSRAERRSTINPRCNATLSLWQEIPVTEYSSP